MQLNDEQREEIGKIKDAHNGILRPRDMVAFAANPRTALHKEFIWDDAKAAYQNRLQTARSLIAVYVTVVRDRGRTITVRPFFSNSTIRHEIGQTSGYVDIEFIRGNVKLQLSIVVMMLSCAKGMLTRFGAFPTLRRLVVDFIEAIEAEKLRVENAITTARRRGESGSSQHLR